MGTVADKLNELLNTKEAVKAAIIEKGKTVTDTDTFASYPDKIRAIETGEENQTISILNKLSQTIKVWYYDHSTSELRYLTISSGITQSIHDRKIGETIFIVFDDPDGMVDNKYDTDSTIYEYVGHSTAMVAITGPNPTIEVF